MPQVRSYPERLRNATKSPVASGAQKRSALLIRDPPTEAHLVPPVGRNSSRPSRFLPEIMQARLKASGVSCEGTCYVIDLSDSERILWFGSAA